MCEPVTASLVLAGVAAGVSAYGQYAAGQAARKVGRRNQIIADRQAADAIQVGAAEESRFNLRISRIMGATRAQLGASGAVVDSGATLSILEDTAAIAELDTLTIRNNAARAAYGYALQGQGFAFEGRLASFVGTVGAGSTLLTGAANVAGGIHVKRND